MLKFELDLDPLMTNNDDSDKVEAASAQNIEVCVNCFAAAT